jgi:hypothetical protein
MKITEWEAQNVRSRAEGGRYLMMAFAIAFRFEVVLSFFPHSTICRVGGEREDKNARKKYR